MSDAPAPTENQPAEQGNSQPPGAPPEPKDTEYRAGRPFVFRDASDLAMRIQQYFDKCDPHTEKRLSVSGHNAQGDAIIENRVDLTEQQPYTITGLARSLGVDRRTLLNYRKYEHYSDDIDESTKQELILTIADAYQRVEEFNEAALHHPGKANGVKFNLVNNFSWQDKTISETRNPADDLDELDDAPAAEREAVAVAAAAELNAAVSLQPAPTDQPENTDEPGPAPTQ